MWKFYLRTSLRSIQRKKLFSLLNMAGLAIGICIFIFSLEFYSYEAGFNKFHPKLDQLYRLVVTSPQGRTAGTFPTIAPLMEKNIPGVHRAIRIAGEFNDGAILSWQPSGNAELRSFREEGCVFADAAFLDAFHFPLTAGTNALDQTNTVILTSSTASRLFGKDDGVGKTIRLHNQFGDLAVKVVGIMADPPDQSDLQYRCLFSIHILEEPTYVQDADWAKLTTWGNDSYTTFLWLDPKTDPQQVAAAATRLWQQNDGDYAHKKGTLYLEPVVNMHPGSSLTWAILALGVLIMIIAWINYINFATADALTKVRDIGVQKILGSGQWQIAGRYVAESMLLNLAALATAILTIGVLQHLFNYLTDRPLSLVYINNTRIWTIIAGILILGCMICGGYTGLLLSRLKPVDALHFNDYGRPGHSLLRKGLVIFQLSISCIFTALTLVAFQQIHYMKTQDLGMDIQRLVVIKGPGLRDSTFKYKSKLFRDETARLPFVEKFTSSGSVPGIGSGHNFGADGITGSSPAKDADKIVYSISEVDDHYFDVYRIPLIAGANFNASDVALSFKNNRIMVNETAARLLGYDPASAPGRIVNWGKTYYIIGVAKDYHHRSLKEEIEPIIYIAQQNNGYYTLKTDLTNLSAKMEKVGELYRSLYPGNAFSYTTVTETFDRLYAAEQRTAVIALSLAVLVILISGLGLAGLSAFTARRRTKEMGVRKVLGASPQRLFLLLSKEYTWLFIISFIISIPTAWYVGRKWLEEFPFRIEPGWQLFTLAGLICLGITMMSISFQAIRTAFVNPVQQLRTD